jgi:hypothetical protein
MGARTFEVGLLSCMAVLACVASGCAEDDARAIKRETKEAEEEFRTVYGLITSLHVDTKHGPDGSSLESVDVTVRLPQQPPGLTTNQVETDANIVVRKHIRKVRNVKVQF